MTTIAYRDGILAADTQCSNGGVFIGTAIKIVRRDDGHMAGGSGNFSYTRRFIAWFLDGEKDEPPLPKADGPNDEGCGYIFRPNGDIVSFEGSGPNTITAPYWAAGSGREFALGAMALGHTCEIRTRHRVGGVMQKRLAEEYGVSKMAISRIMTGKAYADVS